MKSLILSLSLFAAFSATAATLPKYVNCVGNNGMVLEMILTPTEATVPMYKVQLVHEGMVYEHFNGYLEENSDEKFMVQGQMNGHWVAYAGLWRNRAEGFYMKAANNGMSPLPGSYFKPCTVR